MNGTLTDISYTPFTPRTEHPTADVHRIKRWRRAWKNTLVEELNPQWEDLFERAKIELALLADY